MANILVADDDANNRLVLAVHLKMHHHEVRQAANGREALALIHEQQPDIVLLDGMMPELDGFETVRALRSEASTSQLPVVLVTALDRFDRTDRDAGFDAVLPKPFRVKDLLDTISLVYPAAA